MWFHKFCLSFWLEKNVTEGVSIWTNWFANTTIPANLSNCFTLRSAQSRFASSAASCSGLADWQSACHRCLSKRLAVRQPKIQVHPEGAAQNSKAISLPPLYRCF